MFEYFVDMEASAAVAGFGELGQVLESQDQGLVERPRVDNSITGSREVETAASREIDLMRRGRDGRAAGGIIGTSRSPQYPGIRVNAHHARIPADELLCTSPDLKQTASLAQRSPLSVRVASMLGVTVGKKSPVQPVILRPEAHKTP